jgi:hypothetical protein
MAASALVLGGCSDLPTNAAGEWQPSVVVQWDEAELTAIRQTHLGPPMVARALAVVHTAMYDAWAVYDPRAVGTRLGGALRRPSSERTAPNKTSAVSFAAYRALVDLFPSEQHTFDSLMQKFGFDPGNHTTNPATPAGIGNIAAAAVLAFRHDDGANQLGDLASGAYSDYTGYQAVNTPTQVNDPNRWQPLAVPDGKGGTTAQIYVGPQWGRVTPFALTSGAEFRPPAVPNLYPSDGYTQQVMEIIDYSANLTDMQKTVVEFWGDGPGTALPPGHWASFGQWVSRRDAHTLDDDVKMFFALTNALLDASIAAWDCKRAFDYVRPITAVRFLMAGKTIQAWGGPYQGTQTMLGEQWKPYQLGVQPTPAFPEFSSGHSAFSAAGAEVLRSFTGSDVFGDSATIKAGSSQVELGAVPSSDLTLKWPTFSDAADQAGMSRRWGGIHFIQGDLQSRAMGRLVGAQAWVKAQAYFAGSAGP